MDKAATASELANQTQWLTRSAGQLEADLMQHKCPSKYLGWWTNLLQMGLTFQQHYIYAFLGQAFDKHLRDLLAQKEVRFHEIMLGLFHRRCASMALH
jgi:hypothetical protein